MLDCWMECQIFRKSVDRCIVIDCCLNTLYLVTFYIMHWHDRDKNTDNAIYGEKTDNSYGSQQFMLNTE